MSCEVSKKCSKCKEVKLLTFFHKLSSSKDGHRPDCKECAKKSKEKFAMNNPIRHRCNLMANGILHRTVYDVDKPKNKCYKDNNIKSEIGNTYTEISDYLYDNFYHKIKSLIDKGEKPSVDRIDSKKNYSPDNIRIITVEENTNLGVANAIKVTSKPIRAIKGEEVTIYPSIKEASRDIKIKRDTIYAHLDKDTICKKGYKFESIS